ncbi:MAG: hypothetical protein M1834_000998 [Cirrosporium novae-zelandiae]|nr:MAG: hypothetical protein M1834_000998 [Cirrosporium novae-zelandiae]
MTQTFEEENTRTGILENNNLNSKHNDGSSLPSTGAGNDEGDELENSRDIARSRRRQADLRFHKMHSHSFKGRSYHVRQDMESQDDSSTVTADVVITVVVDASGSTITELTATQPVVSTVVPLSSYGQLTVPSVPAFPTTSTSVSSSVSLFPYTSIPPDGSQIVFSSPLSTPPPYESSTSPGFPGVSNSTSTGETNTIIPPFSTSLNSTTLLTSSSSQPAITSQSSYTAIPTPSSSSLFILTSEPSSSSRIYISSSSTTFPESLSFTSTSTSTPTSTSPSTSPSPSPSPSTSLEGGGHGSPTSSTSQPSSSETSSSNGNDENGGLTASQIGGIIGGVAGGLIILTLIAFLVHRWRKQTNKPLLGSSGMNPSSSQNAETMTQRSSAVPLTAAALIPEFLKRGRSSMNTASTSETEPSERGFQKISGRKLPSIFTPGDDGSGGFQHPRTPPLVPTSGVPPSRGNLSPPSVMSPRTPISPSVMSPRTPISPIWGPITEAAEDEVVVIRPGPAHPVANTRTHSPATPPRGSPRIRDPLGRSHPEFNGSRDSKFTEDI